MCMLIGSCVVDRISGVHGVSAWIDGVHVRLY
jgi:hypothetical protein